LELIRQKQQLLPPVGELLRYKVAVSDPEDGSLDNGGVAPTDVSAYIEYRDLASPAGQCGNPFASLTPFAKGRLINDANDCKSCHAVDRKSERPHAIKRNRRANTTRKRSPIWPEKIIKGGSGVWGNVAMSAHPDISEKDANGDRPLDSFAQRTRQYPAPHRRSLRAETPQSSPKHAARFRLPRRLYRPRRQRRRTNRGTETLVLRPYLLQAEAADALSKDARKAQRNQNTFIDLKNGGFLAFKGIDLAGITALEISLEKAVPGASLELRLGAPDGALLGKAAAGNDLVAIPADKASWPADGKLNDLYIVLVSGQAAIDWVNFKT
jgi:cytochrome c